MQTLKLGAYHATLSPMRNLGEHMAAPAKCTGRYKPTRAKADKRLFPQFVAEQTSTAEYVHQYETLNANANRGLGPSLVTVQGFYAGLNDEPCALYSGEDSHEEIDDDDAEGAPCAA